LFGTVKRQGFPGPNPSQNSERKLGRRKGEEPRGKKKRKTCETSDGWVTLKGDMQTENSECGAKVNEPPKTGEREKLGQKQL